ncbi:hypothetical protein [Algicella marina]|uniref:DUF805 domain-containing protein n=1 Tax=Algicella marina TaxID=2683284 RepID=A0A6P1SXY6_9RHOB|nr:hypothetical protein [Algicella marina]QHQ34617.1 hypothetical protein GO499_05135 [Algicella marina]
MTSVLGFLVTLLLLVPPFWKLWSRTGHSGLWSLLMLIPLVNIIMPFWLAFKRWPSEESGVGIVERFE